jgi:hypothetical protein
MTDLPAAKQPRGIAWLSLGLGAVAYVAYFAWLFEQPRGNFEFAYAPFAPEPLPYSPMRGFTYEQLWGHVFRFLLLTASLSLLSFAVTRLRPVSPWASSRRLALIACGASLFVTGFLMLGVLRGRAIVDDELVYRMQATFLSEGRLTGPQIGLVPPDVFSIGTRLGYTGKYLPGEALLQIPGLWLGIPALLHLPVLALTLFAWHRALLLRAGPSVADFGTIALALSPMLQFTTATGHTQATSLCAIVLAGLGYEWIRVERVLPGACLAGAAIGFGLLTRLQAMLPIGAVFGLAIAYALLRRRHFGALAAFAGLIAAGCVALGAYNQALSGSPLTLPWYLQCIIEHYGFGQVWKMDGYRHTVVTALENLLVVLVRLNAWWLGFPCSLAVLGIWWWLGRPLFRAGIWLVVGLAVIAFEFGYFSTGISETGAIYHYELVLPGSLIAGAVAASSLARWPAAAATAIAVHVTLGTTSWIGEQGLRIARLIQAIHADSDAALARIDGPALLFHEIRGSESLRLGWVFDSFPKRFRGQTDRIVTYPMVPKVHRDRILAAYPGRACWYFRRNPESEAVELQRCEDAQALMNRPLTDEEERPLWVRSTAYSLTSYNPIEAGIARRVFDATGQRVVVCCTLRELETLGVEVPAASRARCVPDGP